MKKFRILHLALVLIVFSTVFTSCKKSILGISGSGGIETQELQLPNFTGVESCIAGNIHLTQDSVQQITIKAQQNIIDNLTFSLKNNKLVIENDRHVIDFSSIDIYISVLSLDHAGLSGSGKISGYSAFNKEETVSVDLSGSGEIDLEIETTNLFCTLSGSGSIDLLNETTYSEVDISGSGKIYLSGTSLDTDLNISGSGNVKAFQYEINNVDAHISGSGDMEILASNKLDANISGSGDILYKGYPQVSVNISGSGKVKNVN